MKTFVLLCGICLQLGWSYCASPATNGVAAVAYQDSSGNSLSRNRRMLPPFKWWPPLQPFTRRSAINPRYQPSAGGFSNFPGLPAIPGFPDFPTFDMPNFGDNSAFASASLMAGMGQQIAAISPSNPNQPNINKVTQFSGTSNSNPGMSSVSSSSYASSTNVNGKQVTSRGAQTTIDDNGKVVTYKVQS